MFSSSPCDSSYSYSRSTMFFGHFYPPPPLPPTSATGENRPVDPTIPIEDYRVLDQKRFYQQYGFPNLPVMIQNSGVESWPAWEQWTLESLNAKYGDTLFRVSNIDSNTIPSFNMCFSDFLHYLRYNKDQDPLYLFDPYFVDKVPEMGDAYQASATLTYPCKIPVPKYFEIDFFSLLSKETRPSFRWILIGPQRTGAPWHVDPSGTSAWNTLLSGHKRWALYPPHVIPPGHDPDSLERLSSVEWYLDVYPSLPSGLRPIEIVQHPGQTIYVPSGWWHMVLNMDDTVAVTQNFADETNLRNVKRSMTANKKELTQHSIAQIHRWGTLAQEIPKNWPHLEYAVQESPEDLALTDLKGQSSWLDPSLEDSKAKWEERVIKVLHKSIVNCDVGNITPIHTSQNVCFISSAGFVKFFLPFFDGHLSFASEVKAYITLETSTKKTPTNDDILSTPKMLGHGYLFDIDQVGPSEWRWPYIVMENEEYKNRPNGTRLSTAEDFMPREKKGYNSLLPPILRTLKYLHTLDKDLIMQQLNGWRQDNFKNSENYLAQCLQSANKNHLRWRIFPNQLLESLSSFLPKDAKQVFDPSRGDVTATMVHGDVNPGNLMGYLNQNHMSSLPAQSSEPDKHYPSINQVEQNLAIGEETPIEELAALSVSPPSFIPTSLIDFGDAIFEGDPLIDIVSVFITILNCKRDLEFTDSLLGYWRELAMDLPTNLVSTQLAKRCLWHVLLWPSEGLSSHLLRCNPEIGKMSSWEEVQEVIFGWWSTLQ
ncbi:hypothetical protein BGZ46_008478 [Entomortierella lignicola]|nr:hypothetical protein BGZ46_008478 [Entomortierella lignicola]